MGNAGSRLVAVLNKVREHSNGSPAVDTWATILSVSDYRGNQQDDDVIARRLSMLRFQALALREALADKAETPAFAGHLSRVDQLLSVRLLGQPWQTTRQLLAEETYHVLAATAQLLPDDTGPSVESLADLTSRIDALVDEVAGDAALSQELQNFLRHDLHALRTAVEEYSFGGPRVLQQAADDSAREWLAKADLLFTYQDVPAVRKTWSLWRFLDEATNSRLYRIATLAALVFSDGPQAAATLQSVARQLLTAGTEPNESIPEQDFFFLPGTPPRITRTEDDEVGAAADRGD